ncbi:hypothetical protein ACFPRL_32930 [Pseudoclavibacter helvolus]
MDSRRLRRKRTGWWACPRSADGTTTTRAAHRRRGSARGVARLG